MTDKYYFGMLVEGFLFNILLFWETILLLCATLKLTLLNSDYILVN